MDTGQSLNANNMSPGQGCHRVVVDVVHCTTARGAVTFCMVLPSPPHTLSTLHGHGQQPSEAQTGAADARDGA